MSTAAVARAPRPQSQTEAAQPRILIAGDSSARRRAIRRSLERIRAALVETRWTDYADVLQPAFAAMVIAEPLPVTLAGAVAAVRGHAAGDRLAVYALADGDASSHKARNAYLAGANAVIEWPREKTVFAGILAETMGMSIVRGRSTRPDVALTRTVRAHLRLGPSPGSRIRLSSRKGVVTAAGEARSLADLRRIVETIAAVPGVKRILTSDLRVSPSGIADAQIEKNVKAVIRATSDIDETALTVAVRGGHVKLRGAVDSRARFHDLLDLIATVKGVRDLDWKIELPGAGGRSDATTARRLRQAISTLYPRARIEIAVLGGVAVLSGRVRSLAVKRAVSRQVARDDAVTRVVDKLVVA